MAPMLALWTRGEKSSENTSEPASGRPKPRGRWGCLALAALAGIGGGLLSIFLVAAVRNRDPSPELSRADFSAAVSRWQAAGPQSYRLEVKVAGPQPAVYAVEVRDEDVVSATIDGRPLKQRRTFDTWSVPGMFGTMERDLANVDLVAAGRATRETPRLTLRADFHPDYGYPRRYRRIEWGTGRDMVWEVKKFELLKD